MEDQLLEDTRGCVLALGKGKAAVPRDRLWLFFLSPSSLSLLAISPIAWIAQPDHSLRLLDNLRHLGRQHHMCREEKPQDKESNYFWWLTSAPICVVTEAFQIKGGQMKEKGLNEPAIWCLWEEIASRRLFGHKHRVTPKTYLTSRLYAFPHLVFTTACVDHYCHTLWMTKLRPKGLFIAAGCIWKWGLQVSKPRSRLYLKASISVEHSEQYWNGKNEEWASLHPQGQ